MRAPWGGAVGRLLGFVTLCAAARVALAQNPDCSNAGPEPTWLTSSWWPAGAVFRCGCGFAQHGTLSVERYDTSQNGNRERGENVLVLKNPRH